MKTILTSSNNMVASLWRRAWMVGALLSGFATVASLSAGTPLEPNFTETVFVNHADLANATRMQWATDGSNRLFITRKATGQVRIVENGVLLPTPFATLSPVFSASECGLLGICFDPNYVVNRFVYVFVTVSSSEQRIYRFTDSANVGVGQTLIRGGLPTLGANHNGGEIGIGHDGKLYWSIGDHTNQVGARWGVNDDLLLLSAKVSRANLDGSAPRDNPFYDGTGPNNDYIWARGFRNPYSFAFHPQTGKMWLAVVGLQYEQIFTVGRGDHGGWDNYKGLGIPPAAYLAPAIKYRTAPTESFTMTASGAVRSGNVVTFTTTANHDLLKGRRVDVAGVASATFNDAFFIDTVPTATKFTVNQNGANETSGGGTVTALPVGNCVIGGAFYNSTAFPSAYRGNYFFGDYGSGRLMRAVLDAGSAVTSVDYFVNGVGSYVDNAVGPDGALYYIGHGSGIVYRLAYNLTAQGLIVTPTDLTMVEGGQARFAVRMAIAPTSPVTVSIARASGDTGISVSSGATLTFNSTNFAVPQAVTLTAAEDADATDDTAAFTVSSSGLATQTVNVRAADNEGGILLSTAVKTINEGASGTFTVHLAQAPAANVTVSVARTAGDPSVTVSAGASLTFTPANFATPQTVTIVAAEDADNTAETATISVSATNYTTRTVSITATDNDMAAPVITSTADTTAVAGAAYSYDVNATGTPAPTYSLTASPSGMTINTTSGVISWTPAATGNFGVTVKAANGVSPDATQSYTLVVSADTPPTAFITEPANGAVVSGTTAEFYGDGIDDVGTTKAEFHVDGVLKYTDTAAGGHYHYGGSHALWNTTLLTNGPHTLKMTVYDGQNQTGSQQINVTVSNGSGTPFVTGQTLSVLRNNFTGSHGFKFTVGASPITVTALGRWVVAGNSQTHRVKLVVASTGADVSGGWVDIPTAGAPVGFKYVALPTAKTLAANTAYYVVSHETSGGDEWYRGDTTVTHTSEAVINSTVNSPTDASPWDTTGYGINRSYGPVSFKIQ